MATRGSKQRRRPYAHHGPSVGAARDTYDEVRACSSSVRIVAYRKERRKVRIGPDSPLSAGAGKSSYRRYRPAETTACVSTKNPWSSPYEARAIGFKGQYAGSTRVHVGGCSVSLISQDTCPTTVWARRFTERLVRGRRSHLFSHPGTRTCLRCFVTRCLRGARTCKRPRCSRRHLRAHLARATTFTFHVGVPSATRGDRDDARPVNREERRSRVDRERSHAVADGCERPQCRRR